MTRLGALLILLLFVSSSKSTLAQTHVDLVSSKDNTLYENPIGGISNGSGDYLFAGRTSSAAELRRGLIQFSVGAGLPSGAKVVSVEVTLRMSKSIAGASNVGLHRILADWGESSSNASGEEGGGTAAATGDATWTHRMHPITTWQTPGGEFDSESDASRSVENTGFYTWKSSTLTATVQNWLNNPSSNFGWAIIGDEQASSRSTKRFDSRDNSVAANRPKLRIYYSIGVSTESSMVLPTTLSNLVAFPNPSSQRLNINFQMETASFVTVEMFDLVGRKAGSTLSEWKTAGNQDLYLLTRSLRPGTYILRVATATSQLSKVVIVQ